MNNSNLENLNKLTRMLGADRMLTVEDTQAILKGIFDILATYKKGTESINEDTKKVVNNLLEEVVAIHESTLNKAVDTVLSEKNKSDKSIVENFNKQLKEVKELLNSLKEEMDKEDVEDGSDDEEEKQALIEEIMAQITLPEVKATIVSGEEIIDKINELPLDDDNKIDYSRLKNVPQIKGKVISGSPTVISNAVDLDHSTRQNTYVVSWDATRGRYTHTAPGSGGSGSGDVVGPASATDNAVVRFDTTTGKLIQNSGVTISDVNIISAAGLLLSGLTASQLIATDASKNLVSLDTATYPSLTELSYLKGVSSAIQTQLGTKEDTSNKSTSTSLGTSDTLYPTQNAVKVYVDGAVTGLLDLKGDTDCSTNPNYPSALKGDAYYVTVAGKIGGASGKTVEIGDVYVAKADNAGGTEASVGTSWFVLNQNLSGVALTSGTLAQFAATTSAQLAGVISDETGSGSLVFGTDPTFTTRINVPEIKATSSAGIDVHNNSGTQVALFGAGGSTGTTLVGTTNIGSASADYIQISGGTGVSTQTATGSSTNININLVPKGTGRIQANAVNIPTVSSIDTLTNKTLTEPKFADLGFIADANGNEMLIFDTVTSAVNEITLKNNSTTNAPELQATGGDTNIDLKLVPKGTGIVKGELKRFMVRLVEAATDQATGTAIGGDYRISNRPITIKAVGSYCDTAGTTGTYTVDINEAGTTILSTKITVDSTEKSSETAATAPVISDASIAADAIITFDVDAVQTTKAKGLVVWVDYVYA